jgi:hypothetical protein
VSDGPGGSGPSRVWYWVGGAVVVVGMVAGVLWGYLGFVSLSDDVNGFERVPANGGGEITLARDGGYTIYYESSSGNVVEDLPGGQVALVPVGGGEPVELADYGGRLTYDFAGHAGQALFTFEIDRPGRYVVESTFAARGDLAVGPGVGGRLVRTVVGAVLLAVGGVVAGAIMLIVTAVARHNAGRPAGSPPAAAPWPPSAPPA